MYNCNIEIVGGHHDGKVIAIQHYSAMPEEYILLKPRAEEMFEDIESERIIFVNTGHFKNGRWLFKEEGTP